MVRMLAVSCLIGLTSFLASKLTNRIIGTLTKTAANNKFLVNSKSAY